MPTFLALPTDIRSNIISCCSENDIESLLLGIDRCSREKIGDADRTELFLQLSPAQQPDGAALRGGSLEMINVILTHRFALLMERDRWRCI